MVAGGLGLQPPRGRGGGGGRLPLVCAAPVSLSPPGGQAGVRRARSRLRVSDLGAPEHVWALVAIGISTVVLVVAARRRPGAWLKVMAAILVVDEVSWWVYLLFGGVPGSQVAQSLPLQLCDVAIFVAAALLLVAGMRLHPRRWAVLRVAALTVAYAALVGAVDAITGANYMYLRSKPQTPTLLDLLGPWPVYILSASLIAAVLLAVLDAPFRLGSGQRGAEALR